MLKFDYLVVGSGLAGLYAAYKASMRGSVAVITKSILRESNSFNAQGGIAAVTSDDDRVKFVYIFTGFVMNNNSSSP